MCVGEGCVGEVCVGELWARVQDRRMVMQRLCTMNTGLLRQVVPQPCHSVNGLQARQGVGWVVQYALTISYCKWHAVTDTPSEHETHTSN
jgi:hypothetical protein